MPTSRRSSRGSITEPYVGGATRVVMKRNPYFWQVDTDGNQLPYIDQITFGISQDVESLMLDAISGKIDIQDRHIDSLPNKPTLVAERAEGRLPAGRAGCLALQQCQIYLNITHKDPKMREMFANKDFRQGAVARHQPQGNHRHRLSRPVRALPGRAAAGPSLVPREATRANSPSTTSRKANAILDGLGYKKDAQGVAPAPRRTEDVLRDRRDPDALSGSGRHARAGEAALGRASAST